MNILNNLLLINDRDIWADFSAFLCEDAEEKHDNYAALIAPAPTKAHTSVSLREEHGERLATDLLPRSEGRDITLLFAIVAESPADYLTKYRAFIKFLKEGNKGWLQFNLPSLSLTMRCYYRRCTDVRQLTPIEGGSEQAALLKVTFREPISSF